MIPTRTRSDRPGSRQPSDSRDRQQNKSTDGGQFIDGKFYVQVKRLGRIASILAAKQIGFIDAEDFEDDVFFHFDRFEGSEEFPVPEEGMWVEFELDIEHHKAEDKLRALKTTPTTRPVGRKLSGRDATFRIVTHHPRARRKRPTWRK